MRLRYDDQTCAFVAAARDAPGCYLPHLPKTPRKRGMARREAQSVVGVAIRRPRGRLPARQSQRPYGAGPRFACSWRYRPSGLLERDKQTTASFWRELVMAPGGGSGAARVFRLRTKPAGAAPRPAHANASRERPLNGRGDGIVPQVFGAGIRPTRSPLCAETLVQDALNEFGGGEPITRLPTPPLLADSDQQEFTWRQAQPPPFVSRQSDSLE